MYGDARKPRGQLAVAFIVDAARRAARRVNIGGGVPPLEVLRIHLARAVLRQDPDDDGILDDVYVISCGQVVNVASADDLRHRADEPTDVR